MKFNIYNQDTKQIKTMEFETVVNMWNWYDNQKGNYKVYDEFGNVIYRIYKGCCECLQ